MILAVTGVTSGVGVRLAEIAIERGDRVVGLVRDERRADATALAKKGVRLVRGDLDDAASVAELAKGADALIHCAAVVGDTATVDGPRSGSVAPAIDLFEHPDADGEAFNVMDEVDGSPPSVREVGETIARESGLVRSSRSLPFPIAMTLARAVQRGFAWLKPGVRPPLSPFVVKLMSRRVIYDASKAARVLGWKPRVRTLEGLAREARAYAARRAGA